ncbi:MAG TPA: hypothetical protein VHO67_04225 [Polyangia bacterium]|nr:hypothetical protein [Polyangia bacterium]
MRNGDSRRDRRKRRRQAGAQDAANTSAAVAPSGVEPTQLVDRVDALAGELAALRTRGAILDHVVREMMKLLPAESVIVHADETPAAVEPSRTVIPLATAGRRFGAVEIAMKADHVPQPAERALGMALIRQAALALERVALEDAAWPAAPEAGAAGPSAVSPAAGDAAALARALDRLATDVRRLAALARSAALPPARRVEEAERTAATAIAELRARLLPGETTGEA